MFRIFAVVILVVHLSACSIFNYFYPDKSLSYQDHESHSELTLPEGIQAKGINNVLRVPDISENLQSVPLPKKVNRPAPLQSGLIHLGIQKRSVGGRQWLYIDKPASQVWPELERYFQVNVIQAQLSQPQFGRIDSQWIEASHEYASQLRKTQAQQLDTGVEIINDYRFSISLQPGLQRNTSKLKLLVTTEVKEWPKRSDSQTLETVLLDDLNSFLGESLDRKISVSLLAQEMIREFEMTLVNAKEGNPYLLINQDFNQSWYLAGKAINDVSMPLVDLNRSLALYYFSMDHEDAGDYKLTKLLKTNEVFEKLDDHNEFQIALKEVQNGVEMRVQLNNDKTANKAFALFILEKLRAAISPSHI